MGKEVDARVLDFLKQQKLVTLGFSTGKDSLACALILRDAGVDYIPFFFYQIPDLRFVDEHVKLYEGILERHIVRLPHPMLYDYLRHQDYQWPDMIEYLDEQDIPHLSFGDLIGCYLDSIGMDDNLYDVVGMRAAESFNRRKFFEKRGPISVDERKVYPVYDWKQADVLDFIKAHGVPLIRDYDIWRRSFDGLKYQFLFGLKKHYPEDYERAKEFFPLIDIELFRYEQNQKYFRQQ